MKSLCLSFVLAALLLPVAACTTSSTETVKEGPLGGKTIEDKTVTKNPLNGDVTVEESKTHVP